MSYTLTVGLEIHAELRTQTKMFCHSRNDPDEPRPNQNICPVCMAHPGTLPVINKEAVKHVLTVGLAIGGRLADYTEFDRKNYFYPDLPKGYQISQYEYPLVSGGVLHDVDITRIHLEEDTARSSHTSTALGAGDTAVGKTLIDYNRAGVPLMELVTEPVIHSAEDAGAFARELRLLLRTLGVANANMEKGEMRVEANISVSDSDTFGTKVEVKNLNSFRAVERAIAFEFERQKKILEEGGSIEQETRGWDEMKQQTFSQRVKEGSADYRYFPDPDLPSLRIGEIAGFEEQSLRATMPMLPAERRAKYLALGISEDDAEMYLREPVFGTFFDAVHSALKDSGDTALVRTASNYITTDFAKLVRDAQNIRDTGERDTDLSQEIILSTAHFADLMRMIGKKELSSRAAKDLLAIMVKEGRSPYELAKEHGLMQSNDINAIREEVRAVIKEHDAVAAEYRAGKEAALQFLIGQTMKRMKGAADPTVLKDLFLAELKA